MINHHLDELAIQNYLWNKPAISAEDLQHIHNCEQCMNRVEDYKLLFKAVEEVSKPAFDIDLAALLITRIETTTSSQQSLSNELARIAPVARAAINTVPGVDINGIDTTILNNKKPAAHGWPAIAAIVCLLLVTGVPVYLFREELLEIASNASFMVTWLIVMMVALIAIFLGIDEYRKYNQRINSLDIR